MLTIPFMQQRVYNPHRPGFLHTTIWNLGGNFSTSFHWLVGQPLKFGFQTTNCQPDLS